MTSFLKDRLKWKVYDFWASQGYRVIEVQLDSYRRTRVLDMIAPDTKKLEHDMVKNNVIWNACLEIQQEVIKVLQIDYLYEAWTKGTQND